MSEIITQNEQMLALLALASRVAPDKAPVLIQGESGTGKELLARFIHIHAGRMGPLVAVNCSGIPDALLESELFGYNRGAFTGATRNRAGKFEQAHNGTLLLDEIGDLPIHLQPKLLRVLQEEMVDRLGSIRPIPINTRIVATTNRSIPAMLQDGRFRQDLFYRLNVIPLVIPPLRARVDDIPLLVSHFLKKYQNNGETHTLRETTLGRLQLLLWPGNVRELENALRRGMLFSEGEEISLRVMGLGGPRSGAKITKGKIRTLAETERHAIIQALVATKGNQAQAAHALGITPRTIRSKLRSYGLTHRND
jgi:two-component system response regulator FlrC